MSETTKTNEEQTNETVNKAGHFDDVIQRCIETYLIAQETALMKGLKLVNPRITGEVTGGKLRWRGIRRITKLIHSNDVIEETWFEQRGRQITPRIRLMNLL